MRYEDAAKIGTSVEGYVRCTFVHLLDDQNGFLFSLQHGDCTIETEAHIQAADFFNDGGHVYTQTGASDKVTEEVINDADVVAFVADIPVVKAIAPRAVWGGKKYIECKLTKYCRDMLYKKAMSDPRSQTKYLVQRVWVKDIVKDGEVKHKQGEANVMIDTYKRELAYTEDFLELCVEDPNKYISLYNATHAPTATVMYPSEKYKKIEKNGYMYTITEYLPKNAYGGATSERKEANIDEVLNQDATFLVREEAIDWFPTNISGAFITDANGKLVTIEEALDAAKKRLERAKLLLAAAATTTII